MGEVFVVEHRELGRLFAAKMLHARFADRPEIVDRLRLEGQTLARLNHPNVVAIQGFDVTPSGRPFLIIELLAGHSLTETLRTRGRLPLEVAMRYGSELLSGLAAAHEIGVVHRDVKPDNIVLAESPHLSEPELKLIDFGIARVLPGAPPDAPSPLASPTATGAVVGTPRFLSPEGALGLRVDQRADLYGAALVIYTMLAGRGPFDHVEGDLAVIGAHVNETPVPPSKQTDEPIPAELDALLLKALSKDPNARFGSAGEFKAELERVARHLAEPAGWLETTTYDRSQWAEGGPTPLDANRDVVVSNATGKNGSAKMPALVPSRVQVVGPASAGDQGPAAASPAVRAQGDRVRSANKTPRLSRRALATIVIFALLALLISVLGVVSIGMRLRGEH
jgi:serine/threonine-protein kinase